MITIKVKDWIHCTCPTCGISWMSPKTFTDIKLKNDSKVYCPNGHGNVVGDIS